MRVRLFMALVALAVALGAAQPQQMYRWRDAQGNEHVTTTAPPKGATPLELPTQENPRDKDPSPAESAQRAAREERSAIEATMGEAQRVFWQNAEARIRKARSAGDLNALQKAADAVLFDALWGQGLWAVMGLPLVLVAMGILFGWWLGSGRRRPLAVFFLFLGTLGGLLVSHAAMARFLYRAQSQRLRLSLTILPHFIASSSPLRSDHRQALQQHIKDLDLAAAPLAPPWTFPQEVLAVRDTLQRVVATP